MIAADICSFSCRGFGIDITFDIPGHSMFRPVPEPASENFLQDPCASYIRVCKTKLLGRLTYCRGLNNTSSVVSHALYSSNIIYLKPKHTAR